MAGKRIGYIRVSTAGQNTDRQLDGVELDKVYEEKASAKTSFNRDVLATCLDYCREDDHLFVHSIDRLARNLSDLESVVSGLLEKGVSVTFVKDSLTFTPDTTSPSSTLMRQMLGAFAEFEHTLISNRRREGVEAARKRGVHVGRPRALTPEQLKEVRARAANGESKMVLAEKFGVARSTLYEALKESP